jgi:predicted transcriptional regulator
MPILWAKSEKEQTMKVKLTVEIGKSQKKLLQAMAKRYDATVDELIREAIYEYYAEERKWMKGTDDDNSHR